MSYIVTYIVSFLEDTTQYQMETTDINDSHIWVIAHVKVGHLWQLFTTHIPHLHVRVRPRPSRLTHYLGRTKKTAGAKRDLTTRVIVAAEGHIQPHLEVTGG